MDFGQLYAGLNALDVAMVKRNPDGTFAGLKEGSETLGIPTVKVNPVTGGIEYLGVADKGVGAVGYVPKTKDLAGIMEAIRAAMADYTHKTVLFQDALYALGSGYIPIIGGINYIGAPIRFGFNNAGWTDAGEEAIGGSRFTSSAASVFWDGAEDLGEVVAAVTGQSATFTAGNAGIVVTNGAAFTAGTRCYMTANGYGFYAGVAYYITSISGNTLTLALPDGINTHYSAFTPIAATESGTSASFISAGYPNDSCAGVTMRHLAGVGVNGMIYAGAANTFSFVYSDITDIYATGAPANIGTRSATRLINVTNFAQSNFERIFTHDGDGQYWGANYPQGTFIPGNSKFSHIFDASNVNSVTGGNGLGGQCLVNRGISFQAEAGSTLNEVHADSVQQNRGKTNVGVTVQTDAAASINATTSLTVTDGTLWRKYMPFFFSTIAGSTNVYANLTYYVLSQTGNTLTFSASKGGAVITPTGTGTVTIKSWGFPALEIGGVGAGGQVTGSTFTGLDLEGCATTLLSMQQTAYCDVNPSQCNSTNVQNTITGRTFSGTLRCTSGGSSSATTDFDSASTPLFIGYRGVSTTSPSWKTFLGAGLSLTHDLNSGHSQDIWNLSLHDGKYMASQQLTPGQRGLEGITLTPYQWIRANVPVCTAQYALDTSQTLSNTVYVGVIVFNGAAGQTMTLPTITNTDVTATMVGYKFEFINASGNALTIATNGTQTINNVGAKVSTTLAANAQCIVTASKTVSGTLFWAIQMFTPAP